MTEEICEHEAAEEKSRPLWYNYLAQIHPRPVENCRKCWQIYEAETGEVITVIAAEPDDIDEEEANRLLNLGMPEFDQDEDNQEYIERMSLGEDILGQEDLGEHNRPFVEVIAETCNQCGKTGYIMLVVSLTDPTEKFVTKDASGRELCQECHPERPRSRRRPRERRSRTGETPPDTGEGGTRS